jgi:hydroxymethylbilane synthase
MRIATRGSALALAQARLVAGWLGGAEIVVVRTPDDGAQASGDHDAEQSDHDAGRSGGHNAEGSGKYDAGGSDGHAAGQSDKSRWVAELEQALLAGEVDLAVHSAKDVPGELAPGLELLGAPARASAQDVLVGASSLEQLPSGARVGTSSVRRAAQLLAVREDLEVVSMRGNVDTRMRKLTEERLEAIVLASAGLQRLGRDSDIGCTLDATRFVPAPGQGALALQARAGDASVRAAVEPILDKDASACLTAERAVAHALGASCNTPLGAHAVPAGCGCLGLRAWIGLPDGSEWIADELLGGFYDPRELGLRMAERLDAVGARDLLARAEELAVERA